MSLSDRELMELAAKAAGYEVARCSDDGQSLMLVGIQDLWNPLADDGDALRLAVKLGIQAGYLQFSGEGVALWNRGTHQVLEYGPDDPYAATRRAIVRAAAAIGSTK